MRHPFKPSLLLLALALTCALSEAARGCSCGGWPTSCQAYASAEAVFFVPDTPREGYDGEVGVQTDEQGRFSMPVLHGLKGALRGSMYTYVGEHANCPHLDRLIRKAGERVSQVETRPVRVEVNADVQDVRLVFPFPFCPRAKRE